MKRIKRLLLTGLSVTVILCLTCQPALAVSKEEVEAQVGAIGKEGVAGNVLIWFLCAVAFLKISQKIDSFMSSLGINVGHTGGSLLAEAMIAARGIGAVRGFSGGHSGGGGAGGGHSASGSSSGFLSGGLSGVVGRSVTKGAIQSTTASSSGPGSRGIGGRVYASSAAKGGNFANSVIGTVATGNISSMGSITGEKAEQALSSYMGYAGMEPGCKGVPRFSNVEIGGGRITGVETSAEHPEGIAFGMYSTAQYAPPEGEYSKVYSADGNEWYKQYAADAVEKTPYKAPDGSVAYLEAITKKLPPIPRRKDKL